MARDLMKKCDFCGEETERIAAKLQFIPITPGVTRQIVHSNYSHHADIGICCIDVLFEQVNFRERKTAREYQASRRAG